MAQLWFPGAELVRTEMSEKEISRVSRSSRVISAVMALVAVAVVVTSSFLDKFSNKSYCLVSFHEKHRTLNFKKVNFQT